MYKVCYYPTQSETVVFFKWFKTLQSVIEIKYYNDNGNTKPN